MLTRVLFALALICGHGRRGVGRGCQGAGARAGRPRGHPSRSSRRAKHRRRRISTPRRWPMSWRQPQERRYGRDHAEQRRPAAAQQQRDACRGPGEISAASGQARRAGGRLARGQLSRRAQDHARRQDPDRAEEPSRSRSTSRGGSGPGAAVRASLSKASMASAFSSVSPISSRPSIRQRLRNGSMSNLITPPSGPLISCVRRGRR